MAAFYYDFSEDFYFANKIKKQNRNLKLYKKAFGVDVNGVSNLKGKVGSVRLSGILNVSKTGGCIICFPHGIETPNSTYKNAQRNWKKQRKTQWK